jgi:4'-phosphopantetheinyl transferase
VITVTGRAAVEPAVDDRPRVPARGDAAPDDAEVPVDVWVVPVGAAPAHLCTVDEQDRAARFPRAARGRSSLAARGLLRAVLAEHTGQPARALAIAPSATGRPQLVDTPSGGYEGRLRFSVAHTEHLVAVALSGSPGVDVGIDLEHWDAPIRWDPIVRQLLTDDDQAALRRVPAADRAEALLAWWVRKEAVVKAHGDGFRIPVRRVGVPLVRHLREPTAVVSPDPAVARIAVVDLSAVAGAALAVATRGIPVPQIQRADSP